MMKSLLANSWNTGFFCLKLWGARKSEYLHVYTPKGKTGGCTLTRGARLVASIQYILMPDIHEFCILSTSSLILMGRYVAEMQNSWIRPWIRASVLPSDHIFSEHYIHMGKCVGTVFTAIKSTIHFSGTSNKLEMEATPVRIQWLMLMTARLFEISEKWKILGMHCAFCIQVRTKLNWTAIHMLLRDGGSYIQSSDLSLSPSK